MLDGESVADCGIVAEGAVEGLLVLVEEDTEVSLAGEVIKVRAVQIVVGHVEAENAAGGEVGYAPHLTAPDGGQQLHGRAA